MSDETLLRGIPLFDGLNEAARRVLAERSVVRRFAAGAALWQAGDEPRGLHVLLEGEVRVVRTFGGRRRVVHIEGPGGTLGEIPLFEGRNYPATAVASRRCTCVVFGMDAIVAGVTADPALALALLARLATRVRQLIERVERYSAHSIPMRLAAYLLERHEQVRGDVITLGRTQLEVAEELGTAREVLVRGLRALRQAQIIETAGRGRLRIRDAGRLREIAKG
jgi:CRP/FNR family transcriptional regulator